MMNSNTGYCMLLGISLLLTPEVHSDNWPKDRRLKNSRRASDEFELYRNQHNQNYHRGYHHQHDKLYSEGYTILDTANKSFIPGEEFLVTKSAHSSGFNSQQFKPPHLSDLSKLSVNDTVAPPLPTASRLVNSVVSESNELQSGQNGDARKRTSTEDNTDEDERRILFASKVTSNVIKGPSYESSYSSVPSTSASLSIGLGAKKTSISGYTFDGNKNVLGNSAKQHFKPAITKISLSLGGSGNNNNNVNNNGVGVGSITFTKSGQSSDIFDNHNSNEKKITFGGSQSNEVKINSLVGGSASSELDEFGSSKPNKASVMSSALNVIGGNGDNTQLAHSVLVVQRPKNRPKPTGSVNNVYYWDNAVLTDDSGSNSAHNSDSLLSSTTETTSTTSTTTTTTTTTTPDPFSGQSPSSSSETLHSNHRPVGKPNKTRPWLRPISTTKLKKPTTASLITSSSLLDLSMMPRTTGLPFPFFDDEVPILMSNNHRKFPYSLTTRNKLTSEYANYWTTPSTTALYNDYSMFNKMPPNRRRSTTTTTPSPAMIMGNRPPLKVSHVIASKNKEPDEVKSSVITVLDPHGGSAHLPPNTSIVHRNVLVPYKPGRPKPSPASTTQYPIYPILAGITNWPIQNNYSNINNNNNINDMTVSWQWDETDSYSGTTVPPPFSTGSEPTTSKSPIEYLDPIPVSSINRPTIAIIGSRPGGFGAFRPTPTTIITSSPSASSSSVGTIPTPAQSFILSDVQTQQQHISHSTPSTTTQHVISVTPIGSNTGHVIPSSVNTSTGHQQHIFGEVIHSPRPPSGTAAGHQSDVNLSSSAAAAAASTSSSLSTSGGSQSFIVTTTTTTESSKPPGDSYVHAIYAPPMPSRPVQPLSTSVANTNTLLALFGVDSFSGLFTQLTVFKALLFTALVILLPPLTVAAAFSSLAG